MAEGSFLALFERESQIGARQLIGAADPARSASTVLRIEATPAGLLLQILRQIRRVRAKHDLFQVIRKQQRLGADALSVVQDHALETHVDEVGVGWIRLW